jgi:hypothetical protein
MNTDEIGRAEKALKEAEEHFRAVVETAIDAIVTIDSQGNVVFWNPSAETMFGYSTEEVIGKSITFIMPERFREAHKKGLERVVSTGKPRVTGKVYEVAGLRKDGSEFPVELSLAKWGGRDGTFFTGILRDITERKEAEEVIRKYAGELEESNRLKDLFTDIMRHDLLNPAGVIMNFSELLLEREDDPEKKRFLGTVNDASTRLIEMIESASRYSKLETLEEIDCRKLDLNEVLKDALLDFDYLIEAKEMKVDHLPKGEYPAQANPMIRDVFSNLVSNAIKYSPEGSGIEIDIQDKGREWLFYIKDSGEGIEDEDKEGIFTRFERLGKEGVKGTGLGLAIAKRIVDLHGGRIWVEDNPEGGSIFFVSLPKEQS